MSSFVTFRTQKVLWVTCFSMFLSSLASRSRMLHYMIIHLRFYDKVRLGFLTYYLKKNKRPDVRSLNVISSHEYGLSCIFCTCMHGCTVRVFSQWRQRRVDAQPVVPKAKISTNIFYINGTQLVFCANKSQ